MRPATSAAPRHFRAGDPETTPGAKLLQEGIPTLMAPEPGPPQVSSQTQGLGGEPLDVVFPVLHGTFGEDGTIQGLFELAGIAYVGSGVLGSAGGHGQGRDEAPLRPGRAAHRQARHPAARRVGKVAAQSHCAQVEAALKYPVFVKPANLGSSVGISKAHDRKELGPALDLAAKYDRKLVVEQGVGGKKSRARELEVAVLGNDAPKASVVGEIVPGKEFYDYEAKYLSEGSVPIIPAKLTRAESKTIREMAVAAFRACDLSGLARVDFLMEPGGKRRIFLNEVNTLPGFTQHQHVPQAVGGHGPRATRTSSPASSSWPSSATQTRTGTSYS